MNERIEAISRNTRNTQIHKTSGSVEVGKGLQETVTDGEEKDKLWSKTAVSGEKF